MNQRSLGCAAALLCWVIAGTSCTTRETRDYPDASQRILRFAQQGNTPATAVTTLLGDPTKSHVDDRGRTILQYPVTAQVARDTTLFGMQIRSSSDSVSDELLFQIEDGMVTGATLMQAGNAIRLKVPRPNARAQSQPK